MTLPRFERLLVTGTEQKPKIWGTIGLTLLILIAWLAAVGTATFFQLQISEPGEGGLPALTDQNELVLAALVLCLGFGMGLAAILAVRRGIEQRPLRTLLTGAPRFRWGMMLCAFGLVLVLMGGLSYLTEPELRDTLLDRLKAYGAGQFALVMVVYLVGFSIQSTFEEVFLRGWLTQRLCGHGLSVWISAFLASAIFVSLHIAPGIGPSYLALVGAMGLAFAWSAIRLNGLEFAIGAHIANNFVVGGLYAGLINGSGYEEQEGALISLFVYLLVLGLVVEGFARLWSRLGPERSGLAGLPRLSALA